MIKDLRKIAVIAAAFMIAALPGYLQMVAGDQIAGAGPLTTLSLWTVFAAETDEGQSDDAADENDGTDENDGADEDGSESGGTTEPEKNVSVNVSVGENGMVNGHSSDYIETLAFGQTLSLAIQAASGYAISDILVNGVSLHAADQENVVGQSSATEELEDLEDDISIAVTFAASDGNDDDEDNTEPDDNTGEEGPDEEAGSDDIGENEDGGDDEIGTDGDNDEDNDDDNPDDWDDEDWAGEDEDEWSDENIDEPDEDWDYEDEENLDGETDGGEAGESADSDKKSAGTDSQTEPGAEGKGSGASKADDADGPDESDGPAVGKATGGASDASNPSEQEGSTTGSADTSKETGNDDPTAAGGENRYIAAGSKTNVQSYTDGFPVGKGSSPRTGDPMPVIVVLILLSSLTMLAIIACKERLRKERKVRS